MVNSIGKMVGPGDWEKFVTKAYFVNRTRDSSGSPFSGGNSLLIAEADTFNEAYGVMKRNGGSVIYSASDKSSWHEKSGWIADDGFLI